MSAKAKTAEQPALTLETWPIERLTANPENYRTHPAEQLEHLRESLRAFGWYRNVVITPEGMVLAGHGIIGAAKAEGHTHVPCHVFTGTEAEARKLMVADNEASRLAEDDPDQLSQLLASIAAESEHGLQGTGHDDESLAALLEEVAAQHPPTGFVLPDPTLDEQKRLPGDMMLTMYLEADVWPLLKPTVEEWKAKYAVTVEVS